MKVIVFQEEAYYELVKEMKSAIIEVASKLKEEKEWISIDEAKELLGFRSKSKMQQLRDQGEIDFSQHGRIIKYSRSSIINFLERNKVKQPSLEGYFFAFTFSKILKFTNHSYYKTTSIYNTNNKYII